MSRPARLPPADPWNISLSYGQENPWWFSPDDGLNMWHISADCNDDRDDEQGDRSHVGDMKVTLVGSEIHDPIALLDGWDAELGHIAPVVFDLDEDGELNPALEDRLEAIGSEILVLHDVRLVAEWRGFGFGPLLAGSAIKRLSAAARVAICYPAPINESREATQVEIDDGAWERAVAALQRIWAKLGFEHFHDGVYVLDLGKVTLDERLARLSREAERFRRR